MGKKTGPNPTDRAKRGTKRSMVTDARGMPLGVTVAGANRNDFKLTRETLENIVVERPRPTTRQPPGLCLDKDYDRSEVRELLRELALTPHIRSRGEEAQALKRHPKAKARRWVVERSHSWLNRFRGLLIRWCKKAENYLALIHLAMGIILWRTVEGTAG